MEPKEQKPVLPRVLVNARRGFALEILRGHKFSHVINADHGTISYDRIALGKLQHEWKEFSTESAQLRRFCDVCLTSFRPKTERAERTLREIRSMTIDVQKASTQELIDFYNSKQTDAKKKVKKFADRKTAEERVTKLVATLSPAATTAAGVDADAPIAEDTVKSSTTKGEANMSKKSKPGKSTKADKPTRAAKSKGTAKPAKKAKAGSIADGVKATWGNKKVAAARSLKHKVKVGGEVYRSVAEAFQKLKLNFAAHVKFRKELKESANGRATFEGKVFTLVHDAE